MTECESCASNEVETVPADQDVSAQAMSVGCLNMGTEWTEAGKRPQTFRGCGDPAVTGDEAECDLFVDTCVTNSPYRHFHFQDGGWDKISFDEFFEMGGSVEETQIADLAISAPKIQVDAVTETTIKDGSISSPKIQAGAVRASEIAAESIEANHIVSSEITSIHIAASAITAEKIDANQINAGHVNALSLDTNQIDIGKDADYEIIFDTYDDGRGITNTRMRPSTSAQATGDIGSGGYMFRQAYVDYIFAGSKVRPYIDADLGDSSNRFNGIYGNNIDADNRLKLPVGSDMYNV